MPDPKKKPVLLDDDDDDEPIGEADMDGDAPPSIPLPGDVQRDDEPDGDGGDDEPDDTGPVRPRL